MAVVVSAQESGETLPRYLAASLVPGGVPDWTPLCWPNTFAPDGMQDAVRMPGNVLAWLTSDGSTVDSVRCAIGAISGLCLDAHRPEVMHPLADRFAAGVRCEECAAPMVAMVSGTHSPEVDAIARAADAMLRRSCACKGTGYLRAPAPHIRDFLPRTLGGKLDRVDHAGAILVHWATVGPVAGVYGSWGVDRLHFGRGTPGTDDSGHRTVHVRYGWTPTGGVSMAVSDLTERDLADAAARAHGFALLDPAAPGGLRLPTGAAR